jgi:membrane fusion protein (multidrug efflux system)
VRLRSAWVRVHCKAVFVDEAGDMNQKHGVRWVALGVLVALSAAGWWWQNRTSASAAASAGSAVAAPLGSGSGAPAGGAGKPAMPGVEVARVKAVSLQDDAQAVGTLRSRQNVTLRPEVAGRVSAIAFADGAHVRRGQLLVQLDDVLQKAEQSQAQAQVSIARANLKRNQELLAQNFVAQRVVEESQAALQVAEAQLALAEARLSRMRITAPFDGTVGIRSINLGDYVKDGADLVNLEDTSSLYVDFRLPERFQSKVRVGQNVKVELDALPGAVFEARVQALDPLVDANGRSVSVRAVLPGQASASLRPGMFARTTTVFSTTDAALVVPEEAIVPQAGKQFVFVLDTQGEGDARKQLSRKVEVRLGVRRAATVQVLDGLKEGDTVVRAGQQRLQKDGTAVRVVDLSDGAARKPPAAAPADPAAKP